jgi:hypothetical protein
MLPLWAKSATMLSKEPGQIGQAPYTFAPTSKNAKIFSFRCAAPASASAFEVA